MKFSAAALLQRSCERARGRRLQSPHRGIAGDGRELLHGQRHADRLHGRHRQHVLGAQGRVESSAQRVGNVLPSAVILQQPTHSLRDSPGAVRGGKIAICKGTSERSAAAAESCVPSKTGILLATLLCEWDSGCGSFKLQSFSRACCVVHRWREKGGSRRTQGAPLQKNCPSVSAQTV